MAEAAAELESSASSTETPPPDANPPAESSAAETDANEAPQESLLDVVRNAVQAPETPPEDADQETAAEDSSPSDADQQQAADEAGQESGEDAAGDREQTGEEDPPFHEHPRWKELVSERDALKGQIAELQPAADQFGKVETFMTEFGLDSNHVAEGFTVMALIKNDPVAAREKLLGYVAELDKITGEQLSPDLAAEVEAGRLTQDHASELSRARAVATLERQRAETATQERQQVQASAGLQSIQAHANAVESQIAASDPDYLSVKQELMEGAMLKLMGERGRPTTTADAEKLVRDAYGNVNAYLDRLKPAPEPSRPKPSSVKPTNGLAPDITKMDLRQVVEAAASGDLVV